MRIKFDTNSVTLDDFIYPIQVGGASFDREYGYFKGISPYQRGYGRRQHGAGLGDILKNVWRFLLPVLKKVGTEVGREAVSTGARVLSKIDETGSVNKPEIVAEIKKGIDNIYEKGGMNRQMGTGNKKRIKGERKRAITLIGKKVPINAVKRAKKNRDIFSHGLF